MQPRKCPQCGKTISIDSNYSFDDKLNLICGSCGKIAFPTSWQSTNEIDNAIRENKGGWGTKAWQNKENPQSTFPKQPTCGVHQGQGMLSKVQGLSVGGAQVQSHPPRFGNFPYDDVDDYQGLPFYA